MTRRPRPQLTAACSYTAAYNLLNFPAGVVPVTRQTAEDEAELERSYVVSEPLYTKKIKEATKGGVGLPVGVQCVTTPWADEACVDLMAEVERVTKAGFMRPLPAKAKL
jgi:fatty acid amide hydrolase